MAVMQSPVMIEELEVTRFEESLETLAPKPSMTWQWKLTQEDQPANMSLEGVPARQG